ncbi:MAG: class I SAM-dependent methyltransferase [Candidatus Binataceae bacterium]
MAPSEVKPARWQIDWSSSAEAYAKHRQGFPERFYTRLEAMDVLHAGLRVADLGTGTGTIARELARRGCSVTGMDVSERMIESARSLGRAEELGVRYVVGRAEATALADSSFDLVTAGTCWHWFDRAAAAREARRILLPRGRLVIAAQDFVCVPDGVMEASTRLIAEFHKFPDEQRRRPDHRTGSFLWPMWLDDLIRNGFGQFECFSFEHDLTYTHEGWIGRLRASVGGVTITPEQIRELESKLTRLLKEEFPAEPMEIPHRVFAVIGIAL